LRTRRRSRPVALAASSGARVDLFREPVGRVGQQHAEQAALARRALDRDPRAERVGEATHDVQAEPDAAAARPRYLTEGLEHVAERLARDAAAGVRDADRQTAVLASRRDAHLAVLGELERVVH